MAAKRHSAKQDDNAPALQEARRGRAAAAGQDALAQAASAFGRAGFTDASLVLRWPEIAGASVARVARPLRFSEGPEGATLTLRCAPGAAVFLQHETRALIERLNGYLGRGRVVRLRLVTGDAPEVAPVPPHPSAPGAEAGDSPPPQNLPDALTRLARRRKPRQNS